MRKETSMHVLIASVSAATSPSGVCRHAANMARGLLAQPEVRRVTLLVGAWQEGYFRGALGLNDERLDIRVVAISNTSLTRNLWYLRTLPGIARACGADVVHLAFPMPVVRSSYAAPVIVSVHDLYAFDVPRNFGWRRAWLNRLAMRRCLSSVDAVACVSEETRRGLHELFRLLDRTRTSVVPNAVSLPSSSEQMRLPAEVEESPFLLCVAQHRANKNLLLLLKSFRIAIAEGVVPVGTKLVVVGNEGPETTRLHRVAAESRLMGRVVFLRGLPDGVLAGLYAKCRLFVAPSLLEGFGLPLAEALSAGCRVVCSDIAAFRSAGRAECTFFDPLDSSGDSLVAALRRALQSARNTGERHSFLEPREAAAMYVALYSSLLRGRQAHVPDALQSNLFRVR
jgi:glycosyltransferase involved in cell wall biosynthesis